MTKHNFLTRPGMTAIAAFAALSSTPLLAQEADPLAPGNEPAPSVTSTPPVAVPSEPTAAPVADPLAPAATTAATPTARAARTTTSRTATRTVTRTTRPAARVAAPAVAAAPVASIAAPAPAAAVAPPMAMPEPLPPEIPVATAPVAPPVEGTALPADALPIAGAGLGALALAAAAFALRRRRRRAADDAEQLRYDEPAFAEPVAAETPIADPSPSRVEAPIMAWGATTAAAATAAPVGDGEVPPGVDPASYAAAAYRGPSADNPSLSVKKRLKRAAFFDQREKLAKAGLATPLARDAGLPEALEAPPALPAAPVAAKPAARPLTSGATFSYKPAFQPV